MQEQLGYKTGVYMKVTGNWNGWYLKRPRMNGHIQLIQKFNTEPL